MSEVIIIFRTTKEVIGIVSDDHGNPMVLDSDAEAERLIDEHPFVKHCEHEILEINI